MNILRTLVFGGTVVFLNLLPGLVVAAPTIQHWTTANGARVYFVPAPELPIVDVRVVFDAGSARDGAKAGLARLTNVLLNAGTAALSADAVAERLDAVGARLSSGALRDMAWLALRSLADPHYRVPAVDTVARLLREPAFALESLERERNRMLAALQERAQSPSAIAEQVFYQTLYDKHPYASPPEGTEPSLNAITREDVQAFHRRYYTAANAVVAIVGDLDRAGAERLADDLVGHLPIGETAPPLPTVAPVKNGPVIHVPHPSSQSHINMGELGISRGEPGYYSLYLGNHVLGGGGLVSRLTEEVREKRGLSYSVYSYFSPMQVAGPFRVGLQTRRDQVDEAIKVVEAVLRDFVQQGPEKEELEAARQNITGGFALSIDSNSKIIQYVAMIGFYRLPLDYLQTFTTRIEAVSLEQVTAAFRQRIQPDRLITIIVGGD